jgi:uncharacterized membrane protein YeaQ/YmgE (transglycosylase-associated protein family)
MGLLFPILIGLLARAFTPGKQKVGFVMATLLGIGGSFLGTFLSSVMMNQRVTEFHMAGVIGSVIGALLFLTIGSSLSGPRVRV